MICSGCGNTDAINSIGSLDSAESPDVDTSESISSPNTYLPQVMIDDEIYYLYGDPYTSIEYIPESSYAGCIQSTVSLSQKPTVNGQANFNIDEGSPYARYGNGFIVLWGDVWTIFETLEDQINGIAPKPQQVDRNMPEKAPALFAIHKSDQLPQQRVNAIQLTTSWSVDYEDGTGFGYESDSCGPLQLSLSEYAGATITLENASAEIELQFSDNYPPQSITARRWPSEYATGQQDAYGSSGKGQAVYINGNIIHIPDDGDYIYEIHATWINGKSYYAIRVVGNRNEEIAVFPHINDLDFSDLSDMTFWFGSGVGAWSTELTIHPDGSFNGYYHDYDMGDTGSDYPNGTLYVCYFNGRFTSLNKTGDYKYSMTCESLTQEGTAGEEEIIDGIRYITSTPYGFDNADEFILCLPGQRVDELPEELLRWVSMPRSLNFENIEVLDFWALYNVGGEQGFSW
jgi:hypothetical protein